MLFEDVMSNEYRNDVNKVPRDVGEFSQKCFTCSIKITDLKI